MKKGMLLFETIVAVALFSLVLSYSLNIIFNLSEKNRTQTDDLKNILKLETARLFIQKKSLENISFKNNALFFNGNILLNKVSKFNYTANENIYDINICLENNRICQSWIIK